MDIYFLDMGTEKYGDCIVIERNGRKILIDGAHPGDDTSILRQLRKILGVNGPYEFDLLIMTHCHSDHIGCLPSLVKAGELQAKVSLLANPVYRWGDNEGAIPDRFSDAAILHEALMEEDRSDMNEEELEQFLFDAPRLLPGYLEMIKTLREQGEVVLYDGNDENDYSDLEQRFADFGLKILGPGAEHLRMTQRSLGVAPIDDAIDNLRNEIEEDASMPLTDAYRRLAATLLSDNPEEGLADATNKGAINNQSIVIKVEADGWSALLAGDMQFAKAEVTGMDSTMKRLLNEVNAAGPYDMIKLTHHTSYNGTSEAMLDKWLQNTRLFVHTGGKRDRSHPEESVLEMLKERKNRLKFIRNDRNGILSIGKDDNGTFTFWLSRGNPNNFAVNTTGDVAEQPETIGEETGQTLTEVENKVIEAGEIVETAADNEVVEVTARIPNHSTRVTITIDIDNKKKIPG